MYVETNGDVSFWYKDIGGVPNYRPSLPGDRSCDVCIVGAGYTGLWTAYYLKKADPGLDIVILEKEFAGYGSAGRNGGHLRGGIGWSRERYRAASSRSAVVDLDRALRGTVDEIIRVTEEEGIDADIVRTDGLRVACTPPQVSRVRSMYEEALSWDVPKADLEMIGGAELQARVNVKDALSAYVVHGLARVQPAKLVQGLASAVARLGVTIYEQTAALDIAKGEVRTSRGTVKAARIVRATEGYSASLPGYRRSWIPLNSAIVVTEPLGQDVWDDIGWKNCELVSDASHVYAYSQRTRGGRIAMGGRGVPYRFGSGIDSWGKTQEATVLQLRSMLHRLFPQAKNARLEHAWCGVMGTPRDWCATVGIDESTGIAWGGGYVGLGISTTNLAGQTLADLVRGEQSDLTRLPWVNRQVRNWEVEPLRWLGVHGMYQLYKMADARESSGKVQTTSKLARFADKLTGR